MNKKDFKLLEKKILYQFKKTEILETAFVHPSLIGVINQLDKTSPTKYGYQRMEFLGDRVLGLIVSSWLFSLFPNEVEGDLAKRFSMLVKTETLAEIAIEIDLGQFFSMSPGEYQVGTPTNKNFLADACEVLIAMLYIDGGYQAAEKFIHKFWEKRIHDDVVDMMDPKSALQEWSQANGAGLPFYNIISQEGPQHAPSFTIEIKLKNYDKQIAVAGSKKEAAKKAAQMMLDHVKKKEKAE